MEMSSMTSIDVTLHSNAAVKEGCKCWKVNPAYIPLKIIYFTFMAGQASQVIFRTLFLKHMGMSTTQNGIIWAVDRVVGMFVFPTLGMLADKSGSPQTVITLLCFTGSIFSSLLYFVPAEKLQSTGYDNTSICFTSSCHSNTSSEIYCSSQLDRRSDCSTSSEISKLILENKTCLFLWNNQSTANSSPDLAYNIAADDGDELVRSEVIAGTDVGSWAQNLFMFCKLNLNATDKTSGWDRTLNLTNIIDNSSSLQPNDVCVCFSNSSLSSTEVTTPFDEYGSTFWCLLVITVLASISVFGGVTLIDSMMLGIFPHEERHNLGLQRLWGAVGFAAAPILIGVIKDKITSSGYDPESNLPFIPVFFAPAIFWSVLCIVTWNLRKRVIRDDTKQTIRFSRLKILLYNPRVIAFFVLVTGAGYSISVGEIYLFWLAEDQFNASSTILALTSAIPSCLEVITYIFSGGIVKKFGPRVVMSLGVFMLGVRIYLYTLVSRAWHLIFAEALKGLFWPAFWMAVCHHIGNVAPPSLTGTTMGLVQALTFGFGYGSGAIFGGYLFGKIGGNSMFRISFVMISTVALLYVVTFNCIDHLRRYTPVKKSPKKEQEPEALECRDENHNSTELCFL